MAFTSEDRSIFDAVTRINESTVVKTNKKVLKEKKRRLHEKDVNKESIPTQVAKILGIYGRISAEGRETGKIEDILNARAEFISKNSTQPIHPKELEGDTQSLDDVFKTLTGCNKEFRALPVHNGSIRYLIFDIKNKLVLFGNYKNQKAEGYQEKLTSKHIKTWLESGGVDKFVEITELKPDNEDPGAPSLIPINENLEEGFILLSKGGQGKANERIYQATNLLVQQLQGRSTKIGQGLKKLVDKAKNVLVDPNTDAIKKFFSKKQTTTFESLGYNIDAGIGKNIMMPVTETEKAAANRYLNGSEELKKYIEKGVGLYVMKEAEADVSDDFKKDYEDAKKAYNQSVKSKEPSKPKSDDEKDETPEYNNNVKNSSTKNKNDSEETSELDNDDVYEKLILKALDYMFESDKDKKKKFYKAFRETAAKRFHITSPSEDAKRLGITPETFVITIDDLDAFKDIIQDPKKANEETADRLFDSFDDESDDDVVDKDELMSRVVNLLVRTSKRAIDTFKAPEVPKKVIDKRRSKLTKQAEEPEFVTPIAVYWDEDIEQTEFSISDKDWEKIQKWQGVKNSDDESSGGTDQDVDTETTASEGSSSPEMIELFQKSSGILSKVSNDVTQQNQILNSCLEKSLDTILSVDPKEFTDNVVIEKLTNALEGVDAKGVWSVEDRNELAHTLFSSIANTGAKELEDEISHDVEIDIDALIDSKPDKDEETSLSLNDVTKGIRQNHADELIDLFRFDMLEDTVFMDEDMAVSARAGTAKLEELLFTEVFPTWAGVDTIEKAKRILSETNDPCGEEWLTMLNTAITNAEFVDDVFEFEPDTTEDLF